jgi:hypothetical protein
MTSVFSAALQRFSRIQTQSRELNQIQDNLEHCINVLLKQPFFAGVLLQDITLTAGSGNRIQHGLQRDPIGFVVCGASALAMVSENTGNRSDKIIELNTTTTGTFSLWVF